MALKKKTKDTKSLEVIDVKVKKIGLDLDFDLDTPRSSTKAISGELVSITEPSLDDFDITKVIDTLLESDIGTPTDVKINDTTMPLAPNFLTFLNDAEYMDIRGFARQNEIGTKLFSEYCPRCTDMDWFKDVPVKSSLKRFKKKVVLLEHGTCPKCGAKRVEMIKSGELNAYQELAGCAGQRSAKSHTVALLACYILHWYLKLQKPVRLMGLSKGTILHGTFCALTYGQAKETLWDPFTEYIANSPWFQAYHKLLDMYSEKYGEEVYRLKDTFILYRHRGLLVYPSGPNKKTLRGRTRFLGSIDEIGWFDNDADQKKVKDNANEVYIALERSLLTVRAATRRLLKQNQYAPTAFFLNVSSPSSARDKIMELVQKAKVSKKIYAFHLPTWEMNPNIDREDLDDEYIKDPETAERDYGANPPLTHSPFIRNYSLFEDAQNKKNAVRTIIYKQKRARNGDLTRFAEIEIRPSGHVSILAIDAGYANNSFACVVGHLDLDNLTPVITAMVEIMPLPGIPLNYTLIYNHIITPLIKEMNVKILVSDRWQNIKLLSDAQEDHNITSEAYSLRYDDMLLVRDYHESGDILIPKIELEQKEILEYNQSDYPRCFAHTPVSHFVIQCLTIQDSGKTVTKGTNLTDDLWRAYALANRFLLHEDYRELFMQSGIRKGPAALGAVMTRSGGATGSSSRVSGSIENGSALGTIIKRS